MPALNQNFIKFERDNFSIQWTVVDATTILGSNNYQAWWGLSDNNTPDYAFAPLVERRSNFSGITFDTSTDPEDCSTTATSISGVTTGITVGTYTVTLNLDYATMSTIDPGDYYHELVLMPRTSGGLVYQCRSIVSATGILTINESMFTEYSYR